jgi:hypothetical protein
MQFIYLIAGGLVDYIAYQFFFENARVIFWIIAFPVTIITLGLAFVKVYDRPLGTFIKHAISFSLTPRERTWHKEESLETGSAITGPTVKKKAAPPPAKQLPQGDLAQLSQILDTYGKSSSAGQPGQSGKLLTPGAPK